MRAQRRCVDRIPVTRRRYKRHQPLVTGAFGPFDNSRLMDRIQRDKRRLDIARLDPVAAQFDLIIRPSKTDQRITLFPIGFPARQIARSVEPLAGNMRMVDEGFCGQIGAVVIAARQTCPADIERPIDAHRHRVEALIKDEHIRIGHRLSDGHRPVG